MEYHIESWSVVELPSLSKNREMRLCGIRVEDGMNIVSSKIEYVEGRSITMHTGNIYILGMPSEEYLRHLQDTGIDFNKDNPILMNHKNNMILPQYYKLCNICGYDHAYESNQAMLFHNDLDSLAEKK